MTESYATNDGGESRVRPRVPVSLAGVTQGEESLVWGPICGSVTSSGVWARTSHRLLHKQGGWVSLSLP